METYKNKNSLLKWCVRENEVSILRRTERTMVIAMCDAALVDKKNTD